MLGTEVGNRGSGTILSAACSISILILKSIGISSLRVFVEQKEECHSKYMRKKYMLHYTISNTQLFVELSLKIRIVRIIADYNKTPNNATYSSLHPFSDRANR